MLDNHLTVALIAVVPALLAFWWGRGLHRISDDGTLWERRTALRLRNSAATAAALTGVLYSPRANWFWAIPLLVACKIIVSYSIRRRLHNETWSIFAYTSFFSRLLLAAGGFWILLSLTPWLSKLAGNRDWIAAAALAAVLSAANHFYSVVFRKVMRARPVDDSAVVARFEAMTAVCALRNVSLEQVDMRGGTFVNAVALPSVHRPAVVATSSLLERLDIDETAAVLAHELAHLEHYSPRRIQRLNAINYGLIAAGSLLSPLARMFAPQAHTGLLYGWQFVLFTAMVLRARGRQAHETASDVRALALTGDAEAIARALTKIHAAGRIPRRWDVEFERHATHPSLARRVQAVRTAAGTPPAALGESATFIAPDGSSVTFQPDRLVWNEHDATTHTMPYARLTTLRVDAKSVKTPRLIALDSAQRRWELPLNADDVARAQATLDIVDGHLAAVAEPQGVSPVLARVVAYLAFIAAMSLTQWATVAVTLLAALVPSVPLVGAAGAACIAGGALGFRMGTDWASEWQPWMAGVLLAAGVLLIAITIVNRREPTQERVSRIVKLIAAGLVVSWGAIAVSADGLMGLHHATRDWSSATVLALALAAALVCLRSRRSRSAAAVCALAGVVTFATGSTAFIDRFVSDPFLGQAPPLAIRYVSADNPVSQFEVPFTVDRLTLSPVGRFVAIASENQDEVTTIHAGRAGATLQAFDADAAYFVDDGRLVLLERGRSDSTIRLVDLADQARTTWSHHIDAQATQLAFDPGSGSWRVFVWNEDDDDAIVTMTGTIGADDVTENRWASPRGGAYLQPLSASEHRLLAMEADYSSMASRANELTRFIHWTPRRDLSYRLWTLGSNSKSFIESQLALNCFAPPHDGGATLCSAFDGTRTGFFEVDGLSQPRPLAKVPGRSYFYSDAGNGWITGWLDGAPILIRASGREAIRLQSRNGERPYALAISQRALGAAVSSEHGSTIRVYSIR